MFGKSKEEEATEYQLPLFTAAKPDHEEELAPVPPRVLPSVPAYDVVIAVEPEPETAPESVMV